MRMSILCRPVPYSIHLACTILQHQSESELKLNLDLREYSGGWLAIVAHSVTGVIWMVGQ